MTRLVSKIYSMGPQTPDPQSVPRVWRLCRAMWAQQGTIVVKPSELPADLRGPMTEWADANYGARNNGR